MKHADEYTPQHLGKKSSDPIDQVDGIPWSGRAVNIRLQCEEFTCRCPITKQPDFGSLVISYIPRDFLIETKSLKLYLERYRDQGAFSEQLVTDIANDLYEQIHPLELMVEGTFKSRGGISICAEITLPVPERSE